MDKDLGSLETGKLADLVVLDKNPLENIRNSDSVRSVMLNGRLYDAATLNQVAPEAKTRPPFWWQRPYAAAAAAAQCGRPADRVSAAVPPACARSSPPPARGRADRGGASPPDLPSSRPARRPSPSGSASHARGPPRRCRGARAARRPAPAGGAPVGRVRGTRRRRSAATSICAARRRPAGGQSHAGAIDLAEQRVEGGERAVALEDHVERMRHARADPLEKRIDVVGHGVPMVVEHPPLAGLRRDLDAAGDVDGPDAMGGQRVDERRGVVAQVAAVGDQVVQVEQQIAARRVEQRQQPGFSDRSLPGGSISVATFSASGRAPTRRAARSRFSAVASTVSADRVGAARCAARRCRPARTPGDRTSARGRRRPSAGRTRRAAPVDAFGRGEAERDAVDRDGDLARQRLQRAPRRAANRGSGPRG